MDVILVPNRFWRRKTLFSKINGPVFKRVRNLEPFEYQPFSVPVLKWLIHFWPPFCLISYSGSLKTQQMNIETSENRTFQVWKGLAIWNLGLFSDAIWISVRYSNGRWFLVAILFQPVRYLNGIWKPNRISNSWTIWKLNWIRPVFQWLALEWSKPPLSYTVLIKQVFFLYK